MSELFEKDRADRGIKAVCDAMDDEGLTLFERWWAVHCVEIAARNMLGDGFNRYFAEHADELMGVRESGRE